MDSVKIKLKLDSRRPSNLFFEYVLPYLKPRTTDVHTAVCMSYWSNYTEKLENIKIQKINEVLRTEAKIWKL